MKSTNNDGGFVMARVNQVAAAFIIASLIVYTLILGRGLLIPFILALFIWNLLNIVGNAVQMLPAMGRRIPAWLSMALALFIVLGLVLVLVNIIANNVNDVIDASSRYQDHLKQMLDNIDKRYQIKLLTSLDQFVRGLSFQSLALNIYGVFTTLTGSAVLISLYVVFLFVEQHFFKQKMDALFPNHRHRQLAQSIISHVAHETQVYLGIKTLVSLATASASWLVMRWVHLDFAEFWALLIFFLSYIPNIGAILATAFPALLALFQYQSWMPFIIVTSGIVLIQFIIGNLIEPRYLSKSLNLSPLVILMTLSFWGAIWGILGMFLGVPITMMLMIGFSHFNATRPIAILLSQDGCIKTPLIR